MTDTTSTPPDDFDSLLGTPPSDQEKENLAALNDGGVPAETPEQARIRELEAKLAAAEAAAAAPKEEKTREEKQLEHNQALALTRDVLSAEEKFEPVDGENVIHLHVLETGITVFGRVWYSGQELTIPIDGEAYKSTFDRNGDSWLTDISPSAQIKRWGKQRFGVGPWPYAPHDDEIAAEDKRRGTRVPLTAL